jgi:hypothetical protein
MAPFMIALGVVALAAITTAYYYSGRLIEEDTFRSKNLLNTGVENPIMWLYYDQSDVNSRYWSDFGDRSTRVLNTPYLNLCYESIVKNNGRAYTVKVLAGLSDVALLLGGWNELPKPLQNPIASVGEAELNYIRSTILRRFGGLWVNPSSIFFKSLPVLKNVTFFGTDKDESYSDKNGTPVPGVDVMFSPIKEHPVFVELEELALGRIVRQEGGKQFRKDIKWDLVDVLDREDVDYISNIEFARKSNGRRIQLEDLLGSSDIFIPEKAVYAPLDWEELQKRRNFGWFLRLSERQILESELLVTKLFNTSVGLPREQLIDLKHSLFN